MACTLGSKGHDGYRQMDVIREFLAMDGYAAFVWPAFGATVLVMVGLLLASLRSLRRERRTLEMMQKARPLGRRRRGTPEAAAEPRAGGEA